MNHPSGIWFSCTVISLVSSPHRAFVGPPSRRPPPPRHQGPTRPWLAASRARHCAVRGQNGRPPPRERPPPPPQPQGHPGRAASGGPCPDSDLGGCGAAANGSGWQRCSHFAIVPPGAQPGPGKKFVYCELPLRVAQHRMFICCFCGACGNQRLLETNVPAEPCVLPILLPCLP